jgi:hypothetical protein
VYDVFCIPFLIRLVSRVFCTMMWHGPEGRCIFLYVNIQVLYIYMSRHILRSKCVTCVFCFDVDDVDAIYML